MYYDKKKECSPQETIKKIKSIFSQIELNDLQELLFTRDVDKHCSESLRLYLPEDFFCGTNGKGTTLDYARASAYAEFVERIQNPYIIEYTPADSRNFSVKEFLKSNVIQYFLNKESQNNKKYIKEIIDISTGYTKNKNGKCIAAVPFFHLNSDNVVYFPPKLKWHNSISTGSSAGNTPYEALIEGLSEIFERYVLQKAVLEPISFPEIPEENYIHYDAIKRIISYVKDLDFEISIRDASLNGMYPVICTILQKDNSYMAGFGAHPYLPVAIERCFTEIMQGFDISNSNIVNFLFCHPNSKNNDIPIAKVDNALLNRYTELNKDFFTLSPDYKFDKIFWSKSEELSNKQLFNDIITKLLKFNCNIFIRDVSFLNFPSFQIYIPELMSNCFYITEENGKQQRFDYYRCYNIIKDNINAKITLSEILNFFNYFFHMKMCFSKYEHKNIELFYSIVLIYTKNYNKALKIIKILKTNYKYKSKIKLLNFIEDYILLVEKNTFINNINNELSKKYGKIFTSKIIKLFFKRNSFNKVIKIMKKDKFKENHNNEKSTNRKNKIIKELLKIYNDNIPNQYKLKDLFD